MSPIALLSVSDKQGLVPLAKALTADYGFKLISSGGTAKTLEREGIAVSRVADYTTSPEILGGRVKTLHPKIHGGILANKDDATHQKDLEEQGINHIDLVVVNLYPFKEAIKKSDIQWDEAIENIDIGGPTMIRAAAKNHKDVAVLTRPDQYQDFLNALKENGPTIEMRRKLALEAFEHTADYDIAISRWIKDQQSSSQSPWLQSLPIKQKLRYGENPHQSAIWYSSAKTGWGDAKQIQGKELSTNNLLDLEAALATVLEFDYGVDEEKGSSTQSAAVVIKHTNPCGVATSDCLQNALQKALDADRVSAFGGIVAMNSSVDADCAKELETLFLECVVAPSFNDQAKEILSKKTNLRLIELTPAAIKNADKNYIRSILGGILVQDQDIGSIDPGTWEVATKKSPTKQEKDDLIFAWKVVKHVRSNAIVVASSGQSIGIGAGQMNRIGSAQIALNSANEKSEGSVLASDGFFPFDDTVRLAAKYGVKAIIQPGGSIRDKDSIKACNELGLSMLITGKRHFLH